MQFTIIIPALNESETIAEVVRLGRNSSQVFEVIVVDNGSQDNTEEVARMAGARVLQSPVRGKGRSLKIGLQNATTEFVLFLDGDIKNYATETIESLTAPILSGQADFVKARFYRIGGRVTKFVAKPLLKLLKSELRHFSEPLSGMMAGKKSLLSQIQFENGYGVDLGILWDMQKMKARIVEVHLGFIENKSKPLVQLFGMSLEVATLIFKKHFQRSRLKCTFETSH